MHRPIIPYLIEILSITVEAVNKQHVRKRYMLYIEVTGQSDPFAFLGITVQGMKSKKLSVS